MTRKDRLLELGISLILMLMTIGGVWLQLEKKVAVLEEADKNKYEIIIDLKEELRGYSAISGTLVMLLQKMENIEQKVDRLETVPEDIARLQEKVSWTTDRHKD